MFAVKKLVDSLELVFPPLGIKLLDPDEVIMSKLHWVRLLVEMVDVLPGGIANPPYSNDLSAYLVPWAVVPVLDPTDNSIEIKTADGQTKKYKCTDQNLGEGSFGRVVAFVFLPHTNSSHLTMPSSLTLNAI
jgi:hypothetical protein